MPIPVSVEKLIGLQSVESDRVEFKKGWNPNAVYRTICAFANDFDNAGGGYILIGVEEENGRARRPVAGLSPEVLDEIQREMIGLNKLIRPEYVPLLSIEKVDDRLVLVIWVPGSASRPHEVPERIKDSHKNFGYFIRRYSSTVKAGPSERLELFSLANQVPFDDRPNRQATMDDISFLWVAEFLRATGSRLAYDFERVGKQSILEQMSLLAGPAEQPLPKNVALMMFHEHPEKFFPYTCIEVVRFHEGPADRDFTEKRFEGPVHHQIRQLTDYLISQVIIEKVIKVDYRSESLRIFNYPLVALQEAIANCIFHRDYTVSEPVKVFIHSDKIILFNSGGPDRSVRLEDLRSGQPQPKRYRNRRLGDFLKGLKLTEGHATGIPLIRKELKKNGSPEPLFDIDEERTYFQITFPVHPEFLFRETEVRESGIFYSGQRTVMERGLPSDAGEWNEAYREPTREWCRRMTDRLEHVSGLIVSQLSGRVIRSRKDLFDGIPLSNQTKNAVRYLQPLLREGLVARAHPHVPNAPNQKYYLTVTGEAVAQYLKDNSPRPKSNEVGN